MKCRLFPAVMTAICILMGVSSCKPARSEKVSLDEPGAADLKLRFVLSGAGETVPDFERPDPSRPMEGATKEGNILQLKKRVAISKNNLYLTFADTVGARRVANATYEHKILTQSNSTQSDSHPSILSFDRDQHQYFIPFRELEREKGEALSPMDLQILDIDLTWNDGAKTHFEVRFYVTGELPSAEQVRVSQVWNEPQFTQAAQGVKLSVQSAANPEGWVVLTERYQNPLSRPLLLWFSAEKVSFRLITQLGMKMNWGAQQNWLVTDDAGFQIGPRQFSQASLDQMKLVIRDDSKGDPKTVTFQNRLGVPVRIEPGQTLEVEWRVFASKVSPCKDGGPASWTFRGCAGPTHDGNSFHVKPIENPDCKPPQGFFAADSGTRTHSGVWEVQSIRVKGQFRNDVVLTETIGAQEHAFKEAVQEGLARVLPVRETSPTSASNSEIDDPRFQYSCQGIF